MLAVLAGEGSQYEEFILLQLRLPRALVALGAGAALAISGAIFQTTTHNALASPDIIGITTGASAGVVATLLLWPGVMPVPLGGIYRCLYCSGFSLCGQHEHPVSSRENYYFRYRRWCRVHRIC